MSPRDFGRDAVISAIRERATRGQRRVSIAALCDETGLSRNGVKKAIRRAVDAHQLERVDEGGGRDTGLYRLVNGARSGPVPTLLARKLGGPLSDPAPRDRGVASDPAPEEPAGGHSVTRALSGPDVNRLSAVVGMKGTFEALFADAASPVAASLAVDASAAERSARKPARKRSPARERARRPLFDAIAACWLGAGIEPGKSAGAVVAMAEREVAGYGGTADDVPARWDECCCRYDEPTPMALAKHWIALGRPVRTAQRSARAAEMASASDKAEQLRRAGR